MYEMTVRTPGLTWVRVAPSVNELLAILQGANLPGCEIMVRDRHGAPVALDHGAGAVEAAGNDDLPLAA